MRRRDFLSLAGAAPFVTSRARAQSSVPVVGFLDPVSPDTYAFNAEAFRDGLARAGFIDGRNVRSEYRWGKGDYSRLPAMAAELAAMRVAVIAATGDIVSARAKAATTTIPIVFTVGADPVGHGLVASLARPGGNLGVNLFSSIPTASASNCSPRSRPRRAASRSSSIPTTRAPPRSSRTGSPALAPWAAKRSSSTRAGRRRSPARSPKRSVKADSYITASDPLILDRRGEIVASGRTHGLAGVGFVRQFAAAGALLSYGPGITWMYRQAGIYVAEILKGAKPAELPVVQPTGFELVVNLKTAAALGLEPSSPLLLSANEVIR